MPRTSRRAAASRSALRYGCLASDHGTSSGVDAFFGFIDCRLSLKGVHAQLRSHDVVEAAVGALDSTSNDTCCHIDELLDVIIDHVFSLP